MSTDTLTDAQCILLTVHYASESNIQALHSFTPTRLDALDPELILRILLSYLPETLEPEKYSTYIEEVASRLYLDVTREDIEVDISPVKDLDDAQARKKVKKLDLLEIQPPSFPPSAPADILTRFLCHRSYRIDSETGSLDFVRRLVEPFLDRNTFLRTWYISVVLPLLRLNYEYYPARNTSTPITLQDFEHLDGREGIDLLLANTIKSYETSMEAADKDVVSRDMKGLVGPWMYGHTERKRRRIDRTDTDSSVEAVANGVGKISLGGVSHADKTGHDWEYVYEWMVNQARLHFPMITELVEHWDGPSSIDLGGFDKGQRFYLHSDIQQGLESQYAQAAFASCYAVDAETETTIRGAHGILARLAELLNFIPPPDLASSVDALPKLEKHATKLDQSRTVEDLEVGALLTAEHPLTTPRMETYMLLQMMVYSAYQFSGLGHNISIVRVAKLHFYSTADDQLQVLQTVLKSLAKNGRRDETRWTHDRARLIWLWNWGIDPSDTKALHGAGALGKIEKMTFEQELLKVFVDTSCYILAINTFLQSADSSLSSQQVEDVVAAKALEAYDGASNGNKSRGGIKKANDIITAFRPRFLESARLAEISSLISATHALSFYSLTLQHGVPFQPVSIRVSTDPIDLINKVLEQNPRSYTKLDDLTEIAGNLSSAGLGIETVGEDGHTQNADISNRRKDAARRVTFMAVEAALREDDFETAYSYIINRLTPSTEEINTPASAQHARNKSTSSTLSRSQPLDDDMSWRAAYLAGRFRPAAASPPTLRRLEQRTELLSLALLLAPQSALTDILAAWRRCEEETTALQLTQQQEEQAFDDHADRREPSALPGNFTMTEQPQMILNQKRREMGRMTGSKDAESPVSMFDLTRSAARAFSRNVNLGSRPATETSLESSTDSLRPGSPDDGDQRVRRRDMVANAVSGGLASGIGWVLGAKPVNQ